MEKPELIVEFEKCWNCGETMTVTRKAWLREVEKGKVSEESKDLPLALERSVVPITDPRKGIGLTVTALVVSWDVCSGCGVRRCVRSETQTGPVQVRQMPNPPGSGGNNQGFPFNRG